MTSNAELKRPVASAMHTIGMMVIIAAWSGLGVWATSRRGVGASPDLFLSYSITATLEWLAAGYIYWGVRRHGGTLRDVIGGTWAKGKDFWWDVLIAIGFWIGSLVLLGLLGLALHVGRPPESVRLLAPQSALQILFWIALSCTAGFCEEIIFRGYLQRQFSALSRSVPVGILLSAVIFGAGHAYQGGMRTILIGVYGAMFGTLAYFRRSLRPGMMAHAWQDSIVGVLIRFVPR